MHYNEEARQVAVHLVREASSDFAPAAPDLPSDVALSGVPMSPSSSKGKVFAETAPRLRGRGGTGDGAGGGRAGGEGGAGEGANSDGANSFGHSALAADAAADRKLPTERLDASETGRGMRGVRRRAGVPDAVLGGAPGDAAPLCGDVHVHTSKTVVNAAVGELCGDKHAPHANCDGARKGGGEGGHRDRATVCDDGGEVAQELEDSGQWESLDALAEEEEEEEEEEEGLCKADAVNEEEGGGGGKFIQS